MNNELQCWQERAFSQMTQEEDDAEVNKRLRGRRLRAVKEVAYAVALVASIVMFAALCMAASGHHWE